MKNIRKVLAVVVLIISVLTGVYLYGMQKAQPSPIEEMSFAELSITEEGNYDTKDEVALYIVTYHRLPANYMTKKEAREYGWEGGALHKIVEGMCIGGDVFANREGALPEIDGTYYECDIDTLTGNSRGPKRIVYSDEWDIYYTEDHYETFTKLYGD